MTAHDMTSLSSWKDSSGTRHWGMQLEGEVRIEPDGVLIGQDRLTPVLDGAVGKRIRLTVEVIPHVAQDEP